MAWIAISTPNGASLWPKGLGMDADGPDLIDRNDDALMARGSLLIETRMPPLNQPTTILSYNGGGDLPLHLSLQALPGGGLVFVLDQDGELLHGSVSVDPRGRSDILRVTYSWDAPARRARIAVERPGGDVVRILPLDRPKPLPVADICALAGVPGRARVAPEVVFVAVSTEVEPIGPLPSLAPDTPIATPTGYRPVAHVCAGDLVRAASGRDVPVLARVDHAVPGVGSFSPVRLRAPFLGLARDIRVAAFQRFVLDGSLVEYMFGTETVLAPAACLERFGGEPHAAPTRPSLQPYVQLILPANEPLLAAGAALESLNIGRIRRKPTRFAASLLARHDRVLLPEHPSPKYRVLQPFEAAVMVDSRAA